MGQHKRKGWGPGTIAKLAEAAGMTRQNLNSIIRGASCASADSARRLEAACAELGIELTRLDFLYPKESKSPLIRSGE